MQYKYLVISIGILLQLPLLLVAQKVDVEPCTYKLSGVVIDGESNQPLPGAVVGVRDIAKAAVADTSGKFEIMHLCAGDYVVECRLLGYKVLISTIRISEDAYRKFILHSDTCMMESVVIIAERNDIEKEYTQLVFELSGKSLDLTRGLSLGESVKKIPGVNAIQSGPTIFKPVIQGVYGNRILIMNNGVRLEGQQWGVEHAPEIDPFLANKITVIKGASGVRYGADAIGGVLLIDSKDLRKSPGIDGEVNLVGISNSRGGAGSVRMDYAPAQIKGLSFRIQGTVKRAGNFSAPDYFLKNTGYKEQNFSWQAGYQKKKFGLEAFYSLYNSDAGIFSASHIGNLTDLKNAIASDVPLETSGFSYKVARPYQKVAHELSKVQGHYKFNKWGTLNLSFARQYNNRAEFDKHKSSNASNDESQVRFKITTHTANVNFAHYTARNFSGELGAEVILQSNTTGGTAKSFIPNFRSYAGGIYFIEKWKKERLGLEAGIRYDQKRMKAFMYENNVLVTPVYRFSNFSGSVGSSYDLNENVKLHLNFGSAYRPPSVNELFSDGLHHGAARIEKGDRGLRTEVAYNTSLSAHYHYGKVFGELTVYNNFINDYIYLAPSVKYDAGTGAYVPDYVLTVRGAFPSFTYTQVNAVFTGMDFAFNDSLSRNIIINSRFSLLRAVNRNTGTHLVLIPPANMEYGIKYLFHYSEKLKDPFIAFSHLLVLKKEKVLEYEDFKEPPPTYILFNLEAGATLYVNKQPIDISLAATNVLNSRYRDYLDRFRYFSDGIGRNILLRVKIPFNHSFKSK
ncbi:MAG TPA: TonB-dependent receptor [Cytophagaceae bacterium]